MERKSDSGCWQAVEMLFLKEPNGLSRRAASRRTHSGTLNSITDGNLTVLQGLNAERFNSLLGRGGDKRPMSLALPWPRKAP